MPSYMKFKAKADKAVMMPTGKHMMPDGEQMPGMQSQSPRKGFRKGGKKKRGKK